MGWSNNINTIGIGSITSTGFRLFSGVFQLMEMIFGTILCILMMGQQVNFIEMVI